MKNILLLCLFPLLSIAQIKIGGDIDGEAERDRSGVCISLSADGTTVAIGAPYNTGNGTDSGHVRIYKNTAGTWSQIGSDINGEAASDYSGEGLSLSADGTTVAIGATLNSGNVFRSGHVRVYKNIEGTWSQIGTDIDGKEEFERFGHSVSLSADGTAVAIGSPQNSINGTCSGLVRIYKNTLGTWTQIGQDINGETSFEYFGWIVSLSADGNTVAISAPDNDENSADSGQVSIYENTAGSWTQIGNDIFGEAAEDFSGYSVSLSADATTVAIGAPSNNGNETDSGQVRIYQNTAGTWTQIGADINGEDAYGRFGVSVSLSADGTAIAIGANNNNGNGIWSGQVRIFKKIAGIWSQIGWNIGGEAADDECGWSVSLSSNGAIVAIGAPFNNGNGVDSGQVRIYDLSALLASDSFILAHFSIYPNPTSEIITISLKNNLTLEKVNIYNTLGQLVKTEKQNKINVNSLSKGSYFVEVITSEGKATKTIVVQ